MNSKQISKRKHQYRHRIIDATWIDGTIYNNRAITSYDIGVMFDAFNQSYIPKLLKNCPIVIYQEVIDNIIGMSVFEAQQYYKGITKPYIQQVKLEALLTKNLKE